MDDIKHKLQWAFQTKNALTCRSQRLAVLEWKRVLPCIESGDQVLVCQNGVFGGRMAKM